MTEELELWKDESPQ